ncbi:MAG TPA: bacteriohemerythrin [Candidatus Latescibacteria bacterium]|jgi:hemerythrin|nr:bacteriohemerythrin [Candidatus Latescibacterota bacterium]HJP31722.1 bacteriohemerythrin [Candidatus Latescibacterota bacterium]|tara:strand:+ start:99 stop:494 length:396 start_codon:yes stop_codon:yes gene_type:complete
MKWKEEYATGIPRLDEQHQMLFKMTEDYRVALDEDMGEQTYVDLLVVLTRYCRGHFGFEEDCMEQHKCPMAKENKEAHAQFLDVLAKYQQRYSAIGFDGVDARKLVDTLDQWLDSHICRIDTHLKRCVLRT